MNRAKPRLSIIINALVWAGLLLTSAWLFQESGRDQQQLFGFLLIAGWLTTQGLIVAAGKGRTCSEN